MATFTRTNSNLVGSPGSPSSISVSSSTSGTLTLTDGATDFELEIGCAVIIGGSAPTSNPTVQFSYSLDGTNFLDDDGPYTVPITATSTTYSYKYIAPAQAVKAKVTIANGTGNAITAWAQGTILKVG